MASKKKTTKKVVKKAKPSEDVTPVLVKEQENKAEVISHSIKDNITPHDKFNSLIFIIGLVAVIVLLIIVSPIGNFGSAPNNQNPEAVKGTHLLLTFDNPDMKIGEQVVLTVDANNFQDLVAFELSLGFNSDVLRFSSMTYGDFLGSSGVGKLCVPQKNLGNLIDNIACIKLPSQPGIPEGVSGSGNIAVLTFDVIGRGDLNLQLSDIKLIDSEKASIQYQVVSPNIVVR